ncbi:DUF6191 domain-containing protein [Streptomyces spectabilis]|uniref:Regulatory protein n=1 Tax=Streptomyces spectabilis TaxID=68270 RepID=A0A5P2XBE7_STRST|nr:DUF6191 domain-containing protein [Streptomyces spectabilis]MBB5104315.1 hypothetical protein [Streptomyces spectabilis]MCI3905326.1 DUF6191 domain-containing protein [Streptomyces spectabilis]QEV62323.1 hypothetical protein CP982_29360 [Streptomyces spectabilis]GGU99175.1 hypothetical protein GCM10010245_01740 [Streptomyces spectabilis]
MFNVFEQLFAPGRKHTDDEKKRLELTRVDVDDGDPGKGPIDLSSGKVVVRLPTQGAEDTHPTPGPASAEPAPAPGSASASASGSGPRSEEAPPAG